MIKDLILLANALDEKGFRKEANFVDNLIKRASYFDFTDLKKYIYDFNERLMVMKDLIYNAFSTAGIIFYDSFGDMRKFKKIKDLNFEVLTEDDLVIFDWIQENLIKNKKDLERLNVCIEGVIHANKYVLKRLDETTASRGANLVMFLGQRISLIDQRESTIYYVANLTLKDLNLSRINFYIQNLIDSIDKIEFMIDNEEKRLNELRRSGRWPQTISEDIPCNNCAGTGGSYTDLGWSQCESCDGEGVVYVPESEYFQDEDWEYEQDY